MDLLFPHHECELAQNTAARGKGGVRYWMHNNMITINGQKMGKSLGNFITLEELFTGSHKILTQAYSPMTIRFFILQAHYRSTLDFSNEALQAAEKGLRRMMQASKDANNLSVSQGADSLEEIKVLNDSVYSALCDDLNTPIALAHLFEAVRIVNQVKDGQTKINSQDKEIIINLFKNIVEGVLGLVNEQEQTGSTDVLDGVINIVLDMRKQAKANKDFAASDQIRDKLTSLGIKIKDTKDGTEWNL